MTRIAAKFVRSLLTDKQNHNRMTISQELLERAEIDLNLEKKYYNG